ncbi:MAG: carboxypeptidase-like regulatory domain-containing protein, partial [bacterium]|nr:carboxypeptidase-like regulatory domain-containing protein [bacterium]
MTVPKVVQSFTNSQKRKRNDLRPFLVFLSFLGLFCLAGAATVAGVIYDADLDPLPKAVVSANSTPPQTVVAANGSYSLELKAGAYLLEAEKHSGNEDYAASQYVEITDDG